MWSSDAPDKGKPHSCKYSSTDRAEITQDTW